MAICVTFIESAKLAFPQNGCLCIRGSVVFHIRWCSDILWARHMPHSSTSQEKVTFSSSGSFYTGNEVSSQWRLCTFYEYFGGSASTQFGLQLDLFSRLHLYFIYEGDSLLAVGIRPNMITRFACIVYKSLTKSGPGTRLRELKICTSD